ncbi:hypothetical protein AEP_00070 [Curvibacter sp. AEP1-3]|uniref:hypothetical protein n=1 Tax=Curvibacter sp. AEP1-3 TaxID=1844971 RepID=UPI000B3C7069|nr:hypothetical protein [Curvibacter sp. AEP1-3]ARV17036.1 hypothetical protein AEP_00070 [Curvibacter sp. AEP1-3]
MTEEQALMIAVFVLHHDQESKLRSSEILRKAIVPELRQTWQSQGIELPWHDQSSLHDLAARFSRLLNRHVDNVPASRRQIDGNTNGWKLGPNAGSTVTATTPTLVVTDDTTLIGLSGEYAVMSEILAIGWNAAKPSHDNGVDLFATRKGEIRTVQVKTATLSQLGDGTMRFTGSTRAHQDYNNVQHYYVLVFRTIAGTRWQNNYFVCRSHDFDRLISRYARKNSSGEKWTIEVIRKGHSFLVGGEKDITDKLDRFQERFH